MHSGIIVSMDIHPKQTIAATGERSSSDEENVIVPIYVWEVDT